VLFFLWAQALSIKNQISRLSLKIVFALLFYGIIIEVIQDNWSVSRTGDLMDVLANTIGILLGLIVFQFKRRIYL
jgi:VanZ family protein